MKGSDDCHHYIFFNIVLDVLAKSIHKKIVQTNIEKEIALYLPADNRM